MICIGLERDCICIYTVIRALKRYSGKELVKVSDGSLFSERIQWCTTNEAPNFEISSSVVSAGLPTASSNRVLPRHYNNSISFFVLKTKKKNLIDIDRERLFYFYYYFLYIYLKLMYFFFFKKKNTLILNIYKK